MLSKLRAVLTRSFAADLLGSARSTFDMTNVLDGGLLARLPKGLIGEDMARLAGSLIVARAPVCTWRSATTSRTCRARWKPSWPRRGHRLSPVLAANARNKVCFTLGPTDERVMAAQIGPVLTDTELAHLSRYQAACRLIIGSAYARSGSNLRTSL